MYALGCDCRVKGCYWGRCGKVNRDECLWNTLFKKRDCQGDEVGKFSTNDNNAFTVVN